MWFRILVANNLFLPNDDDSKGKKKLVLSVLLRSLDLMAKWKDIKEVERDKIKNAIMEKYAECFA